MKNVTLTILLMFVGKLVAAQGCKKDSDCDEDQCCLSIYKDLKLIQKCELRKLENELCIQGPELSSGMHFASCPCRDEFVCLPSAYEELPYFGRVAVMARCKTPGTGESDNNEPASNTVDKTDVENREETVVETNAETREDTLHDDQ